MAYIGAAILHSFIIRFQEMKEVIRTFFSWCGSIICAILIWDKAIHWWKRMILNIQVDDIKYGEIIDVHMLFNSNNPRWVFFHRFICMKSHNAKKKKKKKKSVHSDMCAQRRLQSACASPQSDQSLRCLHDETLHSWLSKIAQWRFWSGCANAQADLNLRWAHMSEVTFLTLRPLCSCDYTRIESTGSAFPDLGKQTG